MVFWPSLASPQTCFHWTQESCQHISLDLQQEFHLHVWYINNQDDSLVVQHI